MAMQASMQHVAEAAGVSTATVSNVLNRPHAVAVKTRERVLEAIVALQYQRNESAALLRRGKATNPEKATKKPSKQSTKNKKLPQIRPAITDIDTYPESPTGELLTWEWLPEGHHVRIRYRGRSDGTGVIDGVMPDGSAVWVRFDNGTGRRLLVKNEGFSLSHHSPHNIKD